MISFTNQKVRFPRPFNFNPVNRKIEWPRTKPKNGAYKRNYVSSTIDYLDYIFYLHLLVS